METRKATVACPFCETLNRVNMERVADRHKYGNCRRPILLDRPLAVADANFAQVTTDTSAPGGVGVYADWCGPWKVIATLLDGFAHSSAGGLPALPRDNDRYPDTR